jgi:hypothetical protein
MNINILPNELILIILNKISYRDLFNFRRTCKQYINLYTLNEHNNGGVWWCEICKLK